MNESSSNDNRRARRVLVALVIASAAAAVTAGVALQKHPDSKRLDAEAVFQDAEAGAALDGGLAAMAPIPGRSERGSDSSKRPRPLSESAPTSIDGSADAPSDPSLPAAADALRDRRGADGDPPSTF